jgi:MerR family transcriptional regulator/heat shock protein HspR
VAASNQRDERASRDRAVYVISVAAELAGVHPQTLRIYERRDLLTPKRTSGNSRRYSERDVDVLRRIQELTQDEGVNLAGVKLIMELEQKLEEVELQLQRVRRRAAQAENDLRSVTRRRGELVRLSDIKNIFEST